MKKILVIALILLSVFADAQMTQIQITEVRRYGSYAEGSYKMRFTLPAVYGTGGNPISGLSEIVSSYSGFYTEVIPAIGTVIAYAGSKSFDLNVNTNQIQTFLQNEYASIRAALDSRTLTPIDNMIGLKWNGTTWANINTVTDNPVASDVNTSINATAATGAAVTLTIPAVVGRFHNISHISITAYSTAARTGNATPITVTSTNLGGIAWTFATVAAIGTTDVKIIEPDTELKSAVSNTATTIVCPATTNIIWRVVVLYNTIK